LRREPSMTRTRCFGRRGMYGIDATTRMPHTDGAGRCWKSARTPVC